MRVKVAFDKTEESVFTLLSLCVLITQAFESLVNEEDVFNADYSFENGTFKDMANDTIREALVYQILLKTCSYLEEWNDIFGVRTEDKDKAKILFIKRIAKPAFKNITSWKQLKEFRNHFIAHNHRNKEGRNVFLIEQEYHSPQTDGEIYLLVHSLIKLTNLVNFFFPDVALKMTKEPPKTSKSKNKNLTKTEIKQRIKATQSIDNFISDSMMKLKIVEASITANSAKI
ncbi:MAG: hypothetical protein HYX39_09925 [Bacteroidetes bacterium]|nr:hypothetical protein [Bacteroidota bacterium]